MTLARFAFVKIPNRIEFNNGATFTPSLLTDQRFIDIDKATIAI